MAAMTSGQRAAVARDVMDDLSRLRVVLGALTKAELRAAIDAADQWASDNAASYNTALPQPARSVLTAAQKANILAFVVRARYVNGV